jgi:hypothetical protein
MVPLKRSPRGVNDESGQPKKDEERLRPPDIDAHGLSEASGRESGLCLSHEGADPPLK